MTQVSPVRSNTLSTQTSSMRSQSHENASNEGSSKAAKPRPRVLDDTDLLRAAGAGGVTKSVGSTAETVRTWWSPTGALSSPAAVATTAGGRQLQATGMNTWYTRARGGGLGETVALSGAHGGATLSYARVGGTEMAQRGSAFAAPGYVSGGYSRTIDLSGSAAWANGVGALNTGAWLGAWSDFVGLGASTSVATAATPLGTTGWPLTVQMGAWAAVSGDKTVTYVGRADARDPLVRGKHIVEVHHKAGTTWRGFGGVNLAGIGFGTRGEKGDTDEVLCHIPLSEKEAFASLRSPEGFTAYFRGKAGAPGAFGEDLLLPNPDDFFSFPIGATRIDKRRGTLRGGLMVGPGIAIVGTRGSASTYLRAVRRIGPTTMEVALAPLELRDVSGGLEVPLVGGGGAERHSVIGLRHAFSFDLSDRRARHLYRAMLQGEIPSRFTIGATGEARDLAANALALCEQESGLLPKSVRRTYLEVARVPGRSMGASLRFFFLRRNNGRSNALAYSRIHAASDIVQCDGQRAITKQVHLNDMTRERLWWGTRSIGAQATLAIGRNAERAPELAGLTLQLRVSDSRASKTNLERLFDRRLRNLLGVQTGPRERPSRRRQSTLTVERHLDARDLTVLARLEQSTVETVFEQLGSRWRLRGATRKLLQQMSKETVDTLGRARAVKDYVDRHGPRAMATIHRLLRETERLGLAESKHIEDPQHLYGLEIRSSCGLYSNALARARELALAYARPVRATDLDVDARFRACNRAQERLREALAALDDDPIKREFEPQDFAVLKEQIIAATREVHALTSLSHLSAQDRLDVLRKVKHPDSVIGTILVANEHRAPLAELLDVRAKRRFPEAVSALLKRYREVFQQWERVDRDARDLGRDDVGKKLDATDWDLRMQRLTSARTKLLGAMAIDDLDPTTLDALREDLENRRPRLTRKPWRLWRVWRLPGFVRQVVRWIRYRDAIHLALGSLVAAPYPQNGSVGHPDGKSVSTAPSSTVLPPSR